MDRQTVEPNPVLRDFREGDVREFTHAGGEVHNGAPVSDLHRASWPMRIEKDEEIDGAVAPILETEALKPSRLDRDRRAHFTNQLDRALSSQTSWKKHETSKFDPSIEIDTPALILEGHPHFLTADQEILSCISFRQKS